MTASARLPVVLLWHLHQPQYRDALTGRYVLPWTYLHAIKDYVDMAAHLEANSKARAVVNFTPVLIEQLEELAARVGAHLAHAAPLPDPVLAMLADAPLPDGAERLALLRACLRAHREHMIDRYPAYARLAKLAETFDAIESIGDASDQYLRNLAVCYHLAWLGETVKRGDQRVAALLKHVGDFTPEQRRSLLELIGELLSGLLPRYRRLVDSGQCELSTSPYAHPILPLLLDFRTARESVPAAPLPHASAYPGGAERAAWHLQEALRVFKRVFGVTPAGCWPSEGAISADTLTLIERHGWRWTASSESVLQNCLNGGSRALTSGGGQPPSGGDVPAMQLYRVGGGRLNCLFRNDELSDLIGFTYSGWHGDDAVNNFVARLERLAQAEGEHPGRLLLVALDGENAWDHYPFNGYYFLKGLYAALAEHPLLELTTPSELLARQPPATALPHVVAGSWVHGTLSTWIGERDKNAGWDLLVEAKQAFDAVVASGRLSADDRLHAEHQLALCESSDWFWWLGDYISYEAVRDFDWLYRHQLTSFYRLLGLAVPASLAQPISIGRGAPEACGVMRRAQP
ncbi:MAG: glycoside hydrolase [Steroidobacterales bacterium]